MNGWENYLSYYPLQDDPEIQMILSAKQEFRELASGPYEPVPKRGELFKHQEFVVRFMQHYDRLLISHEPGTGKSCAMIGVAEWFRTHPEAGIRQTIVLVRGESLKNEFRRQIVCKCTDGTYLTPSLLNATSLTQQKSAVTRALKGWYTVIPYQQFVNRVGGLNEDEIISQYSNTLFLVDEIHNVTNTEGVEGIQTVNEEEEIAPNEFQVTQENIFRVLHRIFHTAQYTKIILASATPMIDQPTEISTVMNLILPLDNQINPEMIIKYRNNSERLKEYLIPKFNGRISYVRSLDTGIQIQYQGIRVSNSYVTIYPESMLQHQNEYYLKYQMDIKPYTKGRFERNIRQASNFVFPDGSVGGVFVRGESRERLERRRDTLYQEVRQLQERLDFTRNPLDKAPLERQIQILNEKIDRVEDQLEAGPDTTRQIGLAKYVDSPAPNVYVAKTTDGFRDKIRNIEELRQMSAKYARIIELCREKEGNCFCYNPFLSGCGAILLGICFEAQGFQRYPVRGVSTQVVVRTPPYCQDTTQGSVQFTLSKRLRYALITSDTPENEIDDILRIFNSPQNLNGEYIKVVIGSPITKEGLNLANVLQIHLVAPEWNQSNITQALARAIRATSHIDVLEQLREQYRRQGLNPLDARVQVDIYQHASLSSEDTSIDRTIYLLAEQKNKSIKQIERIMKQSAVDCQIHYERNVRVGDVDGSPECDYQSCKYRCLNSKPDYIDISSYQTGYDKSMTLPIQQIMEQVLKQFHSISIPILDEIVRTNLPFELRQIYNPIFLDQAISEWTDSRHKLTNSDGMIVYVSTDGEFVFTTLEYPYIGTNLNYENAIYTSTYNLDTTPVRETIGKSAYERYQEFELPRNREERISTVLDFYYQIPLADRIAITEQVLLKPEWDKRDRAWIELTSNYLYVIIPRRELLEEFIRRTSLKEPLPEDFDIEIQPIETLSFVKADQEYRKDKRLRVLYAHTLETSKEYQNNSGIIKRFMRTQPFRFVNPETTNPQWQSPDNAENYVYGNVLRTILKRRLEQLEEFGIYGFTKIGKDTSTIFIRDRDRNQEGRACNNNNVEELLQMMYRIQPEPVPLPNGITVDINLALPSIAKIFNRDIEELRQELPQRLEEYLYYGSLLKWIEGQKDKKNALCGLIKDHMERLDLLFLIL